MSEACLRSSNNPNVHDCRLIKSAFLDEFEFVIERLKNKRF